MKQEFSSTPIRHLMIFLRETPPDGIDGFGHQIIHHATYNTEGSNDTSSLYDRISDETKIKVLVTGEIELNEKNVFIGLKMAFPEWDFQRYPLNIQKLFLKKPAWPDAQEVGVIATTDITKNTSRNQWGLPCVLNLSPDQGNQFVGTRGKKDTSSWYEKISSRVSSEVEQVDFDDKFFKEDHFEGDTQESYADIDFASILDLAEEMSNEGFNQELSLDSRDKRKTQRDQTLKEEIDKEEPISGIDSKEIFSGFGEVKKTRPFSASDEEETFDFSFLDEASSFSPTLNEMDPTEAFFHQESFDTRPFYDDEEEYISPEFLEPEIEFELEGFVEEPQIGEDSSLTISKNGRENASSSFENYQEILRKLQSFVLNRVNKLPLRKIALVSLAIGSTTIALSIGVKVFEPDYETTRKAAGIVDLYDWIIMNDLVGPDKETDTIIDLWKESSEYRQFWLWFDTQWTPKITQYQKVESGLITIGTILLSPAMIILLITVLVRIAPLAKNQSQTLDYEQTNKISLDFTTYTNDWSLVDAWAKESGFKTLEVEDTRRLYRRKGSLTHPPILCLIAIVADQVQLEVWVSTRIPTILIPILSDLGLEVLEAKNAVLPGSIKNVVNQLLLKLGHPPLA